MVKNLPAMQETQIRSLGQKDPLEKGMATHSSIRAWRSPWTEEPVGLQSIGLQRAGHDQVTNTHKVKNIMVQKNIIQACYVTSNFLATLKK